MDTRLRTLIDTEVAWLAGVWDAKGIIKHRMRSRGDRQTLYADVELMVMGEIAEPLQQFLNAGHLSQRSDGCWSWNLYKREHQVKLLKAIEPYVTRNYNLIQSVLKFLELDSSDRAEYPKQRRLLFSSTPYNHVREVPLVENL